jgi:pilus assembly protein CpaB
MTYRVRNIGIAVALALVAALLVTFYVSNYKRSVQSAEETVEVYVATRDIDAGATGEDIVADGLLQKEEVARKNVAPGAISDTSRLNGLVLAEPIYGGEQVTALRFSTREETGLRAQITGNERIYQLSGDQHQLLAGTLKAGDRVDVLGTWSVPEGATRHFSRTILRDILVLKAASGPATGDKLTRPGSSSISVSLVVTDAQAQKLFWMARNGEWTLALRAPEDATDSPEGAENAETLLSDGLKQNVQNDLQEGSAP